MLVWSAAAALLAGGADLWAATGFTAGQGVEVREGDTWSAATLVRREGRRYLVHYAGSDASTDEWVGPDRIKATGAAAPPATATPTPPADDPTPRPAARHHPSADSHSDDHNDDGPDEVIPQVDADVSALDAAQTAEPPATWGVTPDAAAKPAAVRTLSVSTPTAVEDEPGAGAGRKWPMRLGELVPCHDGGALLGFSNFREKARTVARVGATAAVGRWTLPAVSLPMSASPSGGVLVCRAKKFGFGNNGRVDVYTLTAGRAAATPLVSFTPYPADDGHGKPEDVRFTAAPTDTRVVTCDLKGRLTAWDVSAKSVRAVWRTDVGSDMHFGGDDTHDLSVGPGGKWVAAAGRGTVSFVELATGRVGGVVHTSDKGAAYDLCWSPSGRTVMAREDDGRLVVVDVTDGREARTVQLPTATQSSRVIGGMTFGGGDGGGPLSCPDDGFALLGGRTLVDAATGAAVPAFKPPLSGWPVLAATGPGATLLAGDGKLLVAHLPDAATHEAAATGADLALKPGMPVALDVSLDGLSEADKAAVDAAVRKKLTDDGFTIAASADTTVVVRTEPGQPHEHYYGKSDGRFPMLMLPPGSGTSIIVTDKVTRITIQQNGKTLWEQRRVSEPAPRVQMKDGQSMQDAVMGSVTYDPKFLETVNIPAYVARPEPSGDPAPVNRPRVRPARST